MIRLFNAFVKFLTRISDLTPLLFRFLLSYGFYITAMNKVRNIDGVAEWFASMNFVFPTLNAYLATITELTGFVFLLFGFATRLISVPLIVVMIVAISTVHWGNGFEAGNNGFEIPLYYLAMLFSLLINGAGKFSLDHLIGKKMNKQE